MAINRRTGQTVSRLTSSQVQLAEQNGGSDRMRGLEICCVTIG